MKINLHFPGQGAQYMGMGLDFYEHYETYRNLIDEAAKESQMDLLSVLKDEEKLNDTENAQVAIFTMSYGIALLLREEGIVADNVLGLSLGEYGALTYAGVLDKKDTVMLLKKRSSLMQKASLEKEGFLAAVSFMERSAVEEAIREIEGVSISNYNAVNQNVVGGDALKKEEFEESIRKHGGKKITYLNVSGAFHTNMMEGAADEFSVLLQDFTFQAPEVPVLSNLKGDYYQKDDDVKVMLKRHIHEPVKLDSCLLSLESTDDDLHILLGPGKALASILKQNKVKGQVLSVSKIEDLIDALNMIKERRNGK